MLFPSFLCIFFYLSPLPFFPQIQDRCEQGLRNKMVKKRAEPKQRGPLNIEAEEVKAMAKLEAIAMYMTDFQSICADYQK